MIILVGAVLNNKYQVKKKIGQGSYGKIFLGTPFLLNNGS